MQLKGKTELYMSEGGASIKAVKSYRLENFELGTCEVMQGYRILVVAQMSKPWCRVPIREMYVVCQGRHHFYFCASLTEILVREPLRWVPFPYSARKLVKPIIADMP
jgi:hypothetical protein